MSGLEIAGLLLGAVPLVISALENYKEGIDVVSDWRNYRSTLKSLKTKLSIQEELYRGTLQRLLLSELSPAEVHALFPEAGTHGFPALWGTKAIEDKLRGKLGAKYDMFMDVVVEMSKIMEQLMAKLDIDMNGKPKWTPKYSADAFLQNRFEWEWRRIRRTFGKTEREELISSFERYNNNLESFVQNREILAPQSDGRATRVVRYFDLVRKHACGLHSILGNSWKCSCSAPHKAYLRLQHPPEANPSPPIFGVAFPCRPISMGETEFPDGYDPAIWKHTFVSISKTNYQQTSPVTVTTSNIAILTSVSTSAALSSTTLHTTSKLSSATQVLKEKKARKVQFSKMTKIISKSSAGHRALPSVIAPTPGIQALNSVPLGAISAPATHPKNISSTPMSLCKALYTVTNVEKILGRFPDAAEDQEASITAADSPELSEAVCLETLLSQTANPPQSHGQLSDKERLHIALTLASTVLQLYDSPWLETVWSRKDIHFLSSESASSSEPAINGPFVSTSFQEVSNVTLEPQPTTNFSLVNSLIPSKTLFALAVMLIELCLGKTLIELQQQNPSKETEVQKSTLLDDYETAHEQLNAVYQKSGSNYGDVVQRCLKCEFNITPKQKRLDFERFRLLVYEGVVAPLEDNYKKYLLYRGDV